MTMMLPMAGLSQRFCNAGYTQPKYMLPLWGENVFYYVVESFRKYFKDWEFVFVFREIYQTEHFVAQTCKKLGLENYSLVELPKPTLGQAHTTMLGLQKTNLADNESLLIFNIDTLRPRFVLPKELDFSVIDGYLEVFEAEGEQWSFILPDADNKVIQTTEKERISNLCSSGLYYFKNAGDFKEAFTQMQQKQDFTHNEFYIAPMYNYLISKNKEIRFHKITLEEIAFCGTPQEYEKLQLKGNK